MDIRLTALEVATAVAPPQANEHAFWGDVPTWIGAIATIFIAIFALRIQRAANRTADRAADTSKRALDRELEDEARNVSWWVEDVVPQDLRDPVKNPDYRPYAREQEAELHLYESWPQQIEGRLWARIRIRNRNEATSIGDVSLLAHGPVDIRHRGRRNIGTVKPGEEFVVLALDPVSSMIEMMEKRELILSNGYASWLQFTDSRGHQWRRHANGHLERCD